MLNVFALQLVAITHATLIDPGAPTTRRDMTIVVRGTRIEQVGASAMLEHRKAERESFD